MQLQPLTPNANLEEKFSPLASVVVACHVVTSRSRSLCVSIVCPKIIRTLQNVRISQAIWQFLQNQYYLGKKTCQRIMFNSFFRSLVAYNADFAQNTFFDCPKTIRTLCEVRRISYPGVTQIRIIGILVALLDCTQSLYLSTNFQVDPTQHTKIMASFLAGVQKKALQVGRTTVIHFREKRTTS